ncbi:MAG: cobalamin-dependent protein [Anaerolineae bacterium]|nr:cobalamin-dependent protein [Anaerolineae bacterium]
MKVLLVLPPHWQPFMPQLALPVLSAYLRANGVEVIQRDLNAELFERLLSSGHLRSVVRQMRREERRVAHKGLGAAQERENLELVSWARERGPALADRIDEVKATLRGPRFHAPALSRDAAFDLADGLRLASVPFYPAHLDIAGYHSPYPIDASQAIVVAARDRTFNLFRSFLQTAVLPQIRQERPDVVGISLTSSHQVVAAFTLAALIKEEGLDVHVTMGGRMVTGWRDRFPHAAPLWELIDSAVAFEGEVALLELVRAIDEGRDLATVPNLMVRQGTGVRVNAFVDPEPVACLPTPDFSGLPLDLYLAPELVLPVWASRGCYWGRCAFCNVGYDESKRFDELLGEQVAEEMLALSRRYGTDKFFFVDEALTPRMLKALSRQLVDRGTSFSWATCVRFEPGIDADLLRQIRRAGCRMLRFGMESGSQRVLDRMHKGTRVGTMQRVLRESAAAGIWNHIFLFLGFPGETEQDAQETTDFVHANQRAIHSIGSATFVLEPRARVGADPEEYGVSRIIPPGPGHDLHYYSEYEVSSGISSRRAEEIEAAFVESLPRKPNPQYYIHEVYQFLHACQFGEKPLPTIGG